MDREQILKDLNYLDEMLKIATTLEDKLYIKDQQKELLNKLKPTGSSIDYIECEGCGS